MQNWSTTGTGDLYTPPEMQKLALQGKVYGHPRYKDGTLLVTTPIETVKGRQVKTRNTHYVLGRIDPTFRQWLKKNRPKWDYKNPITVHKP